MEPSLPAVFSAGVLSFASPCVLPMVPIYLATLSGATVSALSQDPPRGRLVLRASAFALGLAVPFVLLGLAASGEAVLAGAPEVAASTGSACHEGHERASAVIVAMGVAPDDALGSVRLTLGRNTTEAEVTRAADALARSWRRLPAPTR